MTRRLFLLYVLLLASTFARAQDNIPVGTWRMHLTYHTVRSVAPAEEKIYAASDNGLFYFDRASRSLVPVTKIDGLSDNAFNRIAYSQSNRTLVITYDDGNIDLLKDGEDAPEIINIRSLLNSTMEPRHINHILLDGNLAYLSTGFGIVVLDIVKHEIRETYANLGANGTRVEIFATAISEQTLFAASAQGLLAVSAAQNVNRQDFRNWRTVTTPPTSAIKALTARNNTLYFGIDQLGIYTYRQGTVQALNLAQGRLIRDLSTSENTVTVSTDRNVLLIDQNNTARTIENAKIVSPWQAMTDKTGHLWIADRASGLVTDESGNFTALHPAGTFASSIFDLNQFNGKIIGVSGGYTTSYTAQNNLSGFYVFENGNWTNYNSLDPTGASVTTPAVRDLVVSAYVENENKVYIGSFGNGMLVWDVKNNTFATLNANNGSLPYNRVSGLTVDNQGNLWAAFHDVPPNRPSIYRRQGGSWQPISAFSFYAGSFPLDMITDDAGNVWVRLSPNLGGGIVVINPNGQSKRLSNQPGEGKLPDMSVNALVNDKEGNIWVGTDKGLAVFYGAAVIFSENIIAQPLVYNFRELLRGERITALKVDGGNRKWVGTEGGAWLVSADGSQIINHFTTANSPLLSNYIVDIGIQPETGEVFFATSQGIVSYRGTATEASFEYGDVKVFPNPVPPGFGGMVAISGLAANVNVKITDIAGKLVYETFASGGTAVWSGIDYQGKRARTGVYLVFTVSKNGEQKQVTKIAFIE